VVLSASWLSRLWTGPRHPHAEAVEGLKQRQIGAERPAILDADVSEALAIAPRLLALFRGGHQRDLVALRAEHTMDFDGPQQRLAARIGIAGGRQIALSGVDHEEAAIQAALLHARQIDLAVILGKMVQLTEVPAGVEARRRVEMGVHHQHLVVQQPVLRRHVAELRLGGR
jgi:hypothetical protein